MSRSSFVEVNITNPTKLAQDSQDTANTAVKGVTDLNDPNLMSVIEKQNNVVQFAGLTSQYNVLVQNAKDEGINTDSLTTAYNNLNKFMIDVLTDPDHASDVDRKTYKNYQDAYNSELAKIQTALKNNTDGKFASAASATSQAASTASQAASQAQSAVDYTNSQIASQASAVSEASKNASVASSQANSALDMASGANTEIAKLKGGSTLTIAELEGGLGTKVSNDTFTTYQTQTASQFAETVKEADFQTYQTQTSKLIEAKVDSGTYQTDKTQTAKDIASKVSSSDFQTYQTQTDKTISSKVSTADYDEQITLINNNINLKVSKGDLIDEINLQAGNTLISSSGQLTLAANTIYFDTKNPVIIPSANIDSLLVGKKLAAADIAANTFTTNNGTFTVDKDGLVTATSLIIRGSTNLVYNASLSGGNGSYIPGWGIRNNGYYSNQTLHDGVPSIGYHNNTGAGAWVNFAQSKLYSLNGRTGLPYSASVWFLEVGSDTDLKYQFTLAFFDASGNRLADGYAGNTWNGISSRQDWRYVTINNVVSPSTAVYVAIQYWAYNGSGYGLFSSPMLTQTAQATGYQPDTGNIVSAGEIDGSVINGSTINGTTFHGGDVINDSNNTSSFYPFTVEAAGKASTTAFNSADALRTEMNGGGIATKYRATNSSGTTYEAYDGVFTGNLISLNSGFTNGKDMSFSQAVSGSQLTGQVTLSPLTGINLWGSTQSIHFSGLQMNGTGISFNSYGNIVGDVGSTWWRIIDSSGNQVANFGTAPGNNTTFPKPIFVDEVGAYSSSNGGALLIHDQKGTSQMVFRNDGNPQIISAPIYNRTYSSGSTVTITSYGTLGRITSASKYKLAIAREPQIEPADRLLTISPSSWVDLQAAKDVAENKSDGKILLEHEQSLERHHGLIAEDLRDAGLDEFVIYGENDEIEGIQYDRLWTVLIPKIKQLNERINELERGTINE